VEPLSGPRALRIGLTGGIGSGKSTAAAAFVARGATLIDADAISRSLTQPAGAAIAPLRDAFGDAVIDAQGALDRAAMRERAFADPAMRSRLEAILHPLIARQAEQEAARAASTPIVFDIPLLSRASVWRVQVHRILVIDCSARTQIERVLRRPGWTLETAERVVAAQSPRAERRALADALIHNDAGFTLEQLDSAIGDLLRLWKHLPSNPVEQ
jgi:dephospho-CoA kinase